MLPREALLKGAGDHREVISRLLDLAETAIKTWTVVVSTFLGPAELLAAQELLSRLTEVQGVAGGGYPQAERQRLALSRPELATEVGDIPLAAVEISGNFLFDPATHRDFLGALLATGLERDRIGDILVLGERGAQALTTPELVEFLELHLIQVRSVPVRTRQIGLTELKVAPPRVKTLTTVEASLRLDALASAGFGVSRSKMVQMIETGDVQVNWREVRSPSTMVAAGDLISIRGKGRLQVGEVAVTKKDRYRVQLTRYL